MRLPYKAIDQTRVFYLCSNPWMEPKRLPMVDRRKGSRENRGRFTGKFNPTRARPRRYKSLGEFWEEPSLNNYGSLNDISNGSIPLSRDLQRCLGPPFVLLISCQRNLEGRNLLPSYLIFIIDSREIQPCFLRLRRFNYGRTASIDLITKSPP